MTLQELQKCEEMIWSGDINDINLAIAILTACELTQEPHRYVISSLVHLAKDRIDILDKYSGKHATPETNLLGYCIHNYLQKDES